MNDPDLPIQAPDPKVSRAPRWVPSLIWLVPLVAAIIGGTLAVRQIRSTGPTIEIEFATAEGITPGKTKVKYKNVDIGDVTEVHLNDDRTKAVVKVELDHSAEAFAATDSRFWVVRPRLAGATVTGLGTLLSGAYIGVDGGRSKDEQKHFVGLESPPVVTSDEPGKRYVLHADDIGSLDVGAPVYFRRIQVGHLEQFSLDDDGQSITVGIFVRAPYDRFITPETRFWHASGIDLSFDAGGLKLQTQSLATILLGGIAFEPLPGSDVNTPAPEGAEFALAADRSTAVKTPDGPPQTVVFSFRNTVRGLSVGAPIDFHGVTIGQVQSIHLTHDAKTDTYLAPVTAVIYPERLGEAVDSGDAKARAAALVKRGLRAQLRPGNLLTGQMYVALDFFPEAEPAKIAMVEGGAVQLPTVDAEMIEIQTQVRSILKKIEGVPFDEIGKEARDTLVTLNKTLKRLDGVMSDAKTDTLPELKDSLRAISQTLSGDSPTQQDTRAALRAMTDAARALKSLADGLDRNPEMLIRGRSSNK